MPEEQVGAPADPDESVGSVVDEAGRLLAALGDWARDQGPGLGAGVAAAAGTAADAVRLATEHVGEQSGERTGVEESSCTWCPICRTLHVVRSASPEVRTQLGVAATALLQAGAGLLAGFEADQDRRRHAAGDDYEHPGPPSPPGPRGPVQRIELDDLDDLDRDDLAHEDLPGSAHRSGNDNGWEA